MPQTCVVLNCFHRRNKDNPRTFHSFPIRRDPRLCQRWINRVSRTNEDGSQWKPNEFSRICSDHFLPEDFVEGTKVKKLRDDAVPSVFPTHPAYQQGEGTPEGPPPKKRLLTENKEHEVIVSPRKKVALDHGYSGPPIDEAFVQMKAELAEVKLKLAQKTEEAKLLTRKLKRKDAKLASLMQELKSQNTSNGGQMYYFKLDFEEDSD